MKIRKWTSLALAVLMIFALLPATAFAGKIDGGAITTGHKVKVNVYKVEGTSAPVFVQTAEIECTKAATHKDGEHKIKLGAFYPTQVGLKKENWTGYLFASSYNASKVVSKTFNPSPLEKTVLTTTASLKSGVYTATSNMYLVYSSASSSTLPSKPSEKEITALFRDSILVSCNNAYLTHEKTYSLIEGSYEIGKVTDGSPVSCVVTVNAADYVTQFNTDMGVEHTLSGTQTSQTVTLVYNKTTEKWSKQSHNPAVTFNVKCAALPAEPTAQAVAELLGSALCVKMTCDARYLIHSPSLLFELISDSYTVGKPYVSNNACYVDVFIDSAPYLAEYVRRSSGIEHTLSPNEPSKQKLTLKYVDKKWTYAGDMVTFHVVCDVRPDGPTEEELEQIFADRILVECSKAKHGELAYGLLDGGYAVSNVLLDDDYFFRVEVTIYADAYVKQYQRDMMKVHRLDPDTQGDQVVTLYYNPAMLLDDDALSRLNWIVEDDALPVTFTVSCSDVSLDDSTPGASNGGMGDLEKSTPGSLVPGDANPNTGAHSSARPAALTLALAAVSGFAVALKKKSAK